MNALRLVLLAAVVASGCGAMDYADLRSKSAKSPESPSGFSIRGGTGDPTGQYASVVELRIAPNGVCSGSVIGPDLVLTAAHCLGDPNDHTRYVTQIGSISVAHASGTRRVAAKRAVLHPDYRAVAVLNTVGAGEKYWAGTADLLMIQFAENLGYQPLALSTTTPSYQRNPLMKVVGWGMDQNGGFGGRRVGTVHFGFLAASWKMTWDGIYFETSKPDGTIVSRPGPTGQISCPGDSGSPLLNDTREIQGVLSMGYASDYSDGRTTCSTTKNVSYVAVAPEAAALATMRQQLGAPVNTWQNPVVRFDVTGDGRITARDVLMVIADMTANSPRQLTGPKTTNDHYIDVTGDGRITARDPLDILAYMSSLPGIKVTSEQSATRTVFHTSVDNSPHKNFFDAWASPQSASKWVTASHAKAAAGKAMRLTSTAAGSNGARWTYRLEPGTYQTLATYPADAGNAPSVTYDIKFSDGKPGQRARLDQTKAPASEIVDGQGWQSLGQKFVLTKAVEVSVFVTDLNATRGRNIWADAIRFRQE